MSNDVHVVHRWSIRLLLVGLVVELLSLFGLHHPFGFMSFAMISVTCIGAGVILFLVNAARGQADRG